MSELGVAAIQSKLPFLVCGAIGGYLLVMCTNPVRASLRDGARAIRRYSALWLTLGLFAFGDALFQLALRTYYAFALPAGERPAFSWSRSAWNEPDLWLSGTSESIWWLPRGEFLAAVRDAAPLALDSLAGLFNCLITTFPISAVAGVLFLINWQGHQGVLWRALRKRFRHFAVGVHGAIVICAVAAVAKPIVYATAGYLPADLWLHWSPVVVWLSFLFEYLFGVCIQIYLILLAYVWVRGLTFTGQHLLDFAIRRFSYVVKWVALLMLLSTLFIDLPLILKNFAPFESYFPEQVVLDFRMKAARVALAMFILITATMQITLTFHSESWRKALRDHLRFMVRNWWPFSWFLLIAAAHFFALQVLDLSVARGVGEGTALWVAWTLLFPWIAALVGGWLLASWVCVFKRCDTGRAQSDNWMRY
jgi:hypothetical protein